MRRLKFAFAAAAIALTLTMGAFPAVAHAAATVTQWLYG